MTPSQTESPSAPEAIENQRSRGGPWGPVSLLWDRSRCNHNGCVGSKPRSKIEAGLKDLCVRQYEARFLGSISLVTP